MVCWDKSAAPHRIPYPPYLKSLLIVAESQADRLSDTVALFQALGGGWWNREDVDPPKLYPLFSPFQ
jgi:hypothetical protein